MQISPQMRSAFSLDIATGYTEIKNCDYLIAFDEENKQAMLATLRKEPTFKLITVDEFLK